MMFITQHRVRIPNTLAIAAAVMLLASSVADHGQGTNAYSSAPENKPATEASNPDNDGIDNAAKSHRRGLNLGLLLFRHG